MRVGRSASCGRLADSYGFDSSKGRDHGFFRRRPSRDGSQRLDVEKEDENPDFSALVYPVTTMAPENQKWLEETLFHRPMTAEEQSSNILWWTMSAHRHLPRFLTSHVRRRCRADQRIAFCLPRRLSAAGQNVEVHFLRRRVDTDSAPGGRRTGRLSGWGCLPTGSNANRRRDQSTDRLINHGGKQVTIGKW